MGTRSLTVMNDEDTEIAVLYRQYDGFPESHGQELASFLNGFTVVNGLGLNSDHMIANGGGCLAAQIVAHFKQEAGGFYLFSAGTRNCSEEFIYTVTAKAGQEIQLKVESGYEKSMETLYEGTPNGFLIWLEEYKKTEEEE
jgi:hypothetical protein